MDLDCISQNVSISRMHENLINMKKIRISQDYLIEIHRILSQIIGICKREINTICDKQSRYIKNFENFRTKSLFVKIYIYEKYNYTRRLIK